MNILVVRSSDNKSPLIIALKAALGRSDSSINLVSPESYRPDKLPSRINLVVIDCTTNNKLFGGAKKTPPYIRTVLASSRDQVPNGFCPDASFFFINENGIVALASEVAALAAID